MAKYTGYKIPFYTHICAQEEGQPQVSIELQTFRTVAQRYLSIRD